MSFWGSVIFYSYVIIAGGITILVSVDFLIGDPDKPLFRQPFLRFWDWGKKKTEEKE